MDLSDVVKDTPELQRARKILDARAAGLLPVRPSVMPPLSDQECIRLAQETRYTFEAIRKAFPKPRPIQEY